jgi:hypothetical protein
MAMEFDTEEEKKKYQQEHEVRPGTKLTVKKDETPVAPAAPLRTFDSGKANAQKGEVEKGISGLAKYHEDTGQGGAVPSLVVSVLKKSLGKDDLDRITKLIGDISVEDETPERKGDSGHLKHDAGKANAQKSEIEKSLSSLIKHHEGGGQAGAVPALMVSVLKKSLSPKDLWHVKKSLGS